MCIGIPVRVKEIKTKGALIEVEGVEKLINIDLLTEVEVGDYVLLHAGCALHKIEKREAEKTLQFMKNLLEEEQGN